MKYRNKFNNVLYLLYLSISISLTCQVVAVANSKDHFNVVASHTELETKSHEINIPGIQRTLLIHQDDADYSLHGNTWDSSQQADAAADGLLQEPDEDEHAPLEDSADDYSPDSTHRRKDRLDLAQEFPNGVDRHTPDMREQEDSTHLEGIATANVIDTAPIDTEKKPDQIMDDALVTASVIGINNNSIRKTDAATAIISSDGTAMNGDNNNNTKGAVLHQNVATQMLAAKTLNPKPFSSADLPSFENTPIPPKKFFADWQAEQQQQNPVQTAELTSSSFLFSGSPPPGSGYVAACLIARDAHDDLVEWINHHLRLGIFPLYIYDHASTPPLASLVQPYRDSGAVVYTYFTEFSHASKKPQLYVYDRCLQDHGHKHSWMAFIDVDEFLMFRDGPPIQSMTALLQRYEEHSALAVHWILFGSSGHEVRPLQGALKSYVRCLPLEHSQHLFVKTIAHTKCTLRAGESPHAFVHNCTAPAVRTDLTPVFGQTAADRPVHSTLVIHHYATKSAEEFEIKMLRGSGMKRQRGWDYFYFVDSWSTEFNFDGLSTWDGDTSIMPRVIDGMRLEEQIALYSTEEHEDFWGKAAQKTAIKRRRKKKGIAQAKKGHHQDSVDNEVGGDGNGGFIDMIDGDVDTDDGRGGGRKEEHVMSLEDKDGDIVDDVGMDEHEEEDVADSWGAEDSEDFRDGGGFR